MILFHGTDRQFDAFSSEHLNSNADRHANGQLGVWVTTDPELASRFGRYLLAVETPGDRMFDLDLGELSKMSQIDFDYRSYAQRLREHGYDIIAVRERDGSAPTRVLLDPERCKIAGRAEIIDPDAVAKVEALATEENDFAFSLRR